MNRKLVLLAVLVAFITNSAYGVGLGDLQLNSALNQAFDAEIELTNIGALEIQELLPNLASQADFDRVGIQRSDILLDLRFKVVTRADGVMFVKITSNKPTIEPYLNFLVEVLWPSGRLLREYTVLLDPPVFADERIQPVQPAQTDIVESSGMSSTRQRSDDAGSPTSRPGIVPSRPSASGAEVVGSEYGVTGPGDTLWAIAIRVRPDSSVSVQQTMLALQRANPEAFIQDNINLLKAGHVLRIPDMNEIQQETLASAIEEVQVQNDAWENYKSGEPAVAQLDASSRQRQTAASDAGGEEGELKLLAADTREGLRAGAGGDDDARVAELTGELAVALEDLDRTRRANTDLNVRLDDLAGQIETLSQLVQLKDDQLAELQAQLKLVQALAAETALTEPEAQAPQPTSLMSNPLVLGGAGALVILVIAGGLIMRRRRASSEDDEFGEDLEQIEAPDDDVTAIMATDEPEEELESEEVHDDDEDEDITPQTSDVIGEVDIYVAYGRFPQAVTFLKNAINSEPERTDIQLKLLEVYVQTEEIAEFNLQYAALKELGDEQANETAAELQARLPGAAEAAEAAMGATVISTDPIAPIEESAEDDDLSFDLDDLDSETDEDELDIDDLDLGDDLEDEAELDLEIDEGGLDLEEDGLDLDEDDAADMDLDLEFDLDDDAGDADLDLGDDADSDLAETETSDAVEESASDDDDDLDLEGLDLDDDLSLDDLDLDDDSGDLEDTASPDEIDGDGLDDSIELDEASADDELELDDLSLDGLDLDSDGDDLSLEDGDDLSLDVELDLDDDGAPEEESGSKLDLARAYIDMGDNDGARTILEDVVQSGLATEQQEAEELLEKIN